LAVIATDAATPLAFVVAVFTPPANVALAPVCAGAVNVTTTPDTGLLPASLTVACRVDPNAVLIAVLCGVPPVAVTVAAAPATTVSVPESVDVRLATTACIAAAPTRCPVNVALLVSPAATRSPLTTPPVGLANDHVAATFAMKFPEASRLIANPVTVLPDVTFCTGTTVPLPSAFVSTFTDVAAPGTTVSAAVPLIAPDTALIVTGPPAFTPVARPCVPAVLLIVAMVVSDELHVTEFVRFCVELSLNVPVAVNCCVFPTATDGFAGVTAIDASAAAGAVNITLVALSA
jgi:hypothetical protein